MKIDTVSTRAKLKLRREPYWHKVRKGCFLGFRRTASGGTWIARAQVDGQQKYNALGDLAEHQDHARFDVALKAAGSWFDHLAAGGALQEITVRQACERYVQKHVSEGRTKTAADAAARFARWVYTDKRLSDTPVQKLTPGQLQTWRTNLGNTPARPQDKKKEGTERRSDATLNRDMTALRAALNLAFLDGYVMSDAAWRAKLQPLKNAGKRREVYLDAGQRKKLIDKAQTDLVPFLRALCSIPLRPGAIAALRVSDFDKRLSSLKISTDKEGKGRSIKLPPAITKLLMENTKGKLPSAPIFARADGGAWNKDAWKYPLKAAVKAAGLPPSAVAYSIRHSVITDLIALHRLDTMTVALLSGTSVQMIDKHYGHLLKDHLSAALAKIAV